MSFLLTIAWIGICLVAIVLWRSFQNRSLRAYSFFYAYLGGVLLSQLSLYFIYEKFPAAYSRWFWRAEIPTLVLGCGIVLEIFRHVLAPYPGAERVARSGGLCVFALVFSFAFLYPCLADGKVLAQSMEELERDLRCVQAVFLVGIIGIIAYYGLPLGKNIRGLVAGYALYVATSLASLTLGPNASPVIHAIWKELQPISYDATLAVWLAALWVYQPNPTPAISLRLESDYEALVLRTRHAVDGLRAHLIRTARP